MNSSRVVPSWQSDSEQTQDAETNVASLQAEVRQITLALRHLTRRLEDLHDVDEAGPEEQQILRLPNVEETPAAPRRRRRYSGQIFLFGSLMSYLLVHPLIDGLTNQDIILNVVLSIVLVASVFATRHGGWRAAFALVLGIPPMVMSWYHLVASATTLHLSSDLLRIIFNLCIIYWLLCYILKARQVSRDVILAAISAYLLIGCCFGGIYDVVNRLQPGAFAFNVPPLDCMSESHFLFFSLVTLTTVGYGDITPLTPLSRSLASLEAMIGVLYLAILISRLVSLYDREAV